MSSLDRKREELALLEQKLAIRARNSLDAFCRYVPIPGVPVDDDPDCDLFYPDNVVPAAHHRLVNDVLERVDRGEIKRAMFLLPPGTAKTTYASVTFPTWYMGRHAGANIISVSYGYDLAKKAGRRCRSIVRSPEYGRVFNTTLAGNNAAVDDWSIANGATYMAGGILSGITGNRADGLVIDDPIKGREDADSETIRDKTWEAYKSDLRTRLKPGAWITLMLTRWHEDDPSGRILPEGYAGESGWITARDGERWYVLCLPAQCEREDDPLGRKPGEYLWTDWFSPEHWEQEKVSQGPRNWAALYQQRPAPESGDYFRREWLRYYDQPPNRATLRIYGASDYAVTDGAGDWTVHVVVGVDPADNIYLLDLWRGRTTSDVWIEAFLDLCERWKPVEWAEEAGQINKSLGPFIVKRQMERRVYTYRRQYPSAHDKPTRAQAIRARTAMGKLYLPQMAAWRETLEREMLIFPSEPDDQIDALSLIGRMLDHMAKGEPEKGPPPPMKGIESVTLQRLWDDRGKRRGNGMI